MSHRVPHLGLRYVFVFSGLLTPVLIAYLIFSPGALLGAAQQASPDYVAPLVLAEGKADATKAEQPSTSPSGRSQSRGKKQRPQTAEGADESAGKTSSGEQKANRPQFVRLLVRKNEPQYLQTAIVSYVVRDDSSQGKTLSAGETGRSQPAWPKDLRVDLVGSSTSQTEATMNNSTRFFASTMSSSTNWLRRKGHGLHQDNGRPTRSRHSNNL